MNKPSTPWIGVALVIVGLIWIGQGLGYVKGGLMEESNFWAFLGLLLGVGGAVLLYRWWTSREKTSGR